jgi:hypothetical protein
MEFAPLGTRRRIGIRKVASAGIFEVVVSKADKRGTRVFWGRHALPACTASFFAAAFRSLSYRSIPGACDRQWDAHTSAPTPNVLANGGAGAHNSRCSLVVPSDEAEACHG